MTTRRRSVPQGRPWTGAFLAAAGIVAACSGGGGSVAGPSAGASDLDSFLAQYCDSYGPCCSQAGKSYDQAKCKAFYTAFLGSQDTGYNAAAGQQCLNAIRGESSNPSFCKSGASSSASASCKGVFEKTSSGGAKRPGEPCESGSDCASSPDGDVTCLTTISNGANTRSCQLRVRAKEGADCQGTKDGSSTSTSGASGTAGPPPSINICWTEDGLFCDSKTKKCARIQDVGGPCEGGGSQACTKAGYCDSATKKCVPRKPVGEACTASTPCAEKSYCSSTSKTCTASLADGSPCTKNEECEAKSCTNNVCGSSINGNLTASLLCGG